MEQECELAERFRKRDRAAVREIVHRLEQPLFAFVFGMLGQREDSEDVVQDVFIRAVGAADRYDPERATLKTWLYTIARNRCRTMLRSRAVSANLSLDSEPSGQGEDPSDRLVRSEQRKRLDAALAKLPETQRAAFLLCEVQQLTLAEAAEIEDVPIGTIKSRCSRAKERLRASLHEEAVKP